MDILKTLIPYALDYIKWHFIATIILVAIPVAIKQAYLQIRDYACYTQYIAFSLFQLFIIPYLLYRGIRKLAGFKSHELAWLERLGTFYEKNLKKNWPRA